MTRRLRPFDHARRFWNGLTFRKAENEARRVARDCDHVDPLSVVDVDTRRAWRSQATTLYPTEAVADVRACWYFGALLGACRDLTFVGDCYGMDNEQGDAWQAGLVVGERWVRP